MTTISVIHIIGTPVAISATDGLKLFDELQKFVEAGQSCKVSFADVENLTSAFCNASLGKLYMQFGPRVDDFIFLHDIGNDVWLNKLMTARKLGINETLRAANNQSIADLFQ